jgi:hypothetical protein
MDGASQPGVIAVPVLQLDEPTVAAFEEQLAGMLRGGSPDLLAWPLPYPKHVFLRWLAEVKGYLLHGSNRGDIEQFEPREQTDAAQKSVRAVFAASDGIWPMYFAIVDRSRRHSLQNWAWRGSDGSRGYYFAVNTETLTEQRFVVGTIYVLAPDGFANCSLNGTPTEEWSNPAPVTPIARLTVEPGDFPYLDQIAGLDARDTFRLVDAFEVVLDTAVQVVERPDGVELVVDPDAVGSAVELVMLLWSVGWISDLAATLSSTVADHLTRLRLDGSPLMINRLREWAALPA